MYLYNQPGLGEAKKLVHRRRSNRVSAPVPSPVAGFGEFGAPIFDFPQPCAECPVGTAAQCRAALRQAIVRAIGLATNAAAKIEAAISVAPAARNADAKRTATLFVRFFGHDPSRPVSWAGKRGVWNQRCQAVQISRHRIKWRPASYFSMPGDST